MPNAQSEDLPTSSQHPGTLLKHPPSPEHSNQPEDTTTDFYDSNYFFTIQKNSINCPHTLKTRLKFTENVTK